LELTKAAQIRSLEAVCERVYLDAKGDYVFSGAEYIGCKCTNGCSGAAIRILQYSATIQVTGCTFFNCSTTGICAGLMMDVLWAVANYSAFYYGQAGSSVDATKTEGQSPKGMEDDPTSSRTGIEVAETDSGRVWVRPMPLQGAVRITPTGVASSSVDSPRKVELNEGGSGKDAKGDGDGTTGATTPKPSMDLGGVQCSCPAPVTGGLAGHKGVPVKGKSEVEDKPKSRFPSKRELARRDTARIDKQRRDDEAMEEMERQAIRLRITGQSLGTMRAGPPEPKEAGKEWVVQWDRDAAWRMKMSQPGSGRLSFAHNPTYAELSGRMGCKMDAIAEEVGQGNVIIRQRAIGARKKDHRPKYQRKK
jgi:hypothetical protein